MDRHCEVAGIPPGPLKGVSAAGAGGIVPKSPLGDLGVLGDSRARSSICIYFNI